MPNLNYRNVQFTSGSNVSAAFRIPSTEAPVYVTFPNNMNSTSFNVELQSEQTGAWGRLHDRTGAVVAIPYNGRNTHTQIEPAVSYAFPAGTLMRLAGANNENTINAIVATRTI